MNIDRKRERVQAAFHRSIETLARTQEQLQESLLQATEMLVSAIRQGGKILACGNGGSAADAQHFVAELVVRLRSGFNRPAIPALALTTDTSILTAGANDYGFENVFARQVEALGREGDVLVVFSTSGNSPNVVEATRLARQKGVRVIGILGGDGGALKKMVDLPLIVDSRETARIQEVHGVLIHILCDLLETELFDGIGQK